MRCRNTVSEMLSCFICNYYCSTYVMDTGGQAEVRARFSKHPIEVQNSGETNDKWLSICGIPVQCCVLHDTKCWTGVGLAWCNSIN